MDSNSQDDLDRIKTLLQRTGEFIGYFELAENKMMQWRQEISQQLEQQNQQAQSQLEQIQKECRSLQTLLSQSGIQQLKANTEKVLAQGEANLSLLEQKSQKMLSDMEGMQERVRQYTQQSLQGISLHTNKTIKQIDAELSKYDVQQFHRIANESCDQVERVAQDAVSKSSRLLTMFQWRFSALTIITTLLTAFIIGLYVSSEYPWEAHSYAKNERQAGKILLDAWPHLSHQDKLKILHNEKKHA